MKWMGCLNPNATEETPIGSTHNCPVRRTVARIHMWGVTKDVSCSSENHRSYHTRSDMTRRLEMYPCHTGQEVLWGSIDFVLTNKQKFFHNCLIMERDDYCSFCALLYPISYVTNISVSGFTSHLNTGIIVSIQSWVNWFSTNNTFFNKCNQTMHSTKAPSWCCNLPMLHSLFHVSRLTLYTTKINSCMFISCLAAASKWNLACFKSPPSW